MSTASGDGPGRPYRVALTGARTFFGERLIAALEQDPACEHIAALDIRPPDSGRTKTRFSRLDLTDPSSDEQAAKVLKDDGIDVLCHLAFLAHPSHASSWAHELEAIGSLYIMNAAATARVPKVVLRSTTAVYGAHPANPAFLTERHTLRGEPRSRWVMDKVAAERELARLRKDCPHIVCTSMRFGMTVGPTIRTWWSRMLTRQSVPRLMGYDPMMQFLHEDDAVDALLKVVREDHPGDFNVVAPGTLYYTDVLKLGGRVGVPMPHGFGYSFGNLLFNLQLADAPGTFLNYLRYTWVADDRRMREQLGFTPRHTSREAIVAFYKSLARRDGAQAPGFARGAV